MVTRISTDLGVQPALPQERVGSEADGRAFFQEPSPVSLPPVRRKVTLRRRVSPSAVPADFVDQLKGSLEAKDSARISELLPFLKDEGTLYKSLKELITRDVLATGDLKEILSTLNVGFTELKELVLWHEVNYLDISNRDEPYPVDPILDAFFQGCTKPRNWYKHHEAFVNCLFLLLVVSEKYTDQVVTYVEDVKIPYFQRKAFTIAFNKDGDLALLMFEEWKDNLSIDICRSIKEAAEEIHSKGYQNLSTFIDAVNIYIDDLIDTDLANSMSMLSGPHQREREGGLNRAYIEFSTLPSSLALREDQGSSATTTPSTARSMATTVSISPVLGEGGDSFDRDKTEEKSEEVFKSAVYGTKRRKRL